MIKLKEIYEAKDLKKFNDICGSFLEGEDHTLDEHALPKYYHNYNETPSQVDLTVFLNSQTGSKLILEMGVHLHNEIDDAKKSIKSHEDGIVGLKAKIKKREEVLKMLSTSKSFISFFRKIITQ